MTDIVINSKKRLLWPRVGFALNVGRNVVAAVPSKCVRKLEQLRKAGILSVEQSNGARLSSSALPVVEKKSSRTAQPLPAPPAPPEPLSAAAEGDGGSDTSGEGGESLDGESGEGDADDEDPEDDTDENAPTGDDAKAVLEAGSARQKRGKNKRR